MRNTIRRAIAVAVGIVALASPGAHASPSDREPDRVVVTQDAQCRAEPVYQHARFVGAIVEGEVVTVLRRVDGFVRIETESSRCWAIDGDVSSRLGGDLDPSTWSDNEAVVVDPGDGLPLGSVLSGSPLSARAAPARGTTVLREMVAGDLLTVAPWTVTGGAGLTGEDTWRPVSLGGVIAWVRVESLALVPTRTIDDLGGTLVAEVDASVREAPSSAAPIIGTLGEGEAVAADLTPVAGWLAVEVDGGVVGWVAQADLVGSLDPIDPTQADPTEPGDSTDPAPSEPGLIDGAQQRYEDWLAEHESEEAAAPGSSSGPSSESAAGGGLGEWWSSLRDRLSDTNPVAEAAAKARLYLAGGLGMLAALLAAAVAMTSRARIEPDRRPGTARVAQILLAPALAPLFTWATTLAAPAVALTAALVAPTDHHVVRVLGGAAVVGLLVASAIALRLAARRGVGRDALSVHVRSSSTALLLVAGAVGAVVTLVVGAGTAVGVVAGLLAAGMVAGTQARGLPPAHLSDVGSDPPLAAHLDEKTETEEAP